MNGDGLTQALMVGGENRGSINGIKETIARIEVAMEKCNVRVAKLERRWLLLSALVGGACSQLVEFLRAGFGG
uniref:Haemolysin XhlA n=1 Tax=Candidatus Kentrum sp. LFY TaxID=2126342 RepID=A0A450WDC1_9GAMM|nr:MAG: hypothetical protein BECKLFY1418C_GA0070996_101220 [Candidatus Kentron sp. LFY]